MRMTLRNRLLMLVTVLCGTIALFLRIEPWRDHTSAARDWAVQAQLDQQKSEAERLESERIQSGELWVGQLYPEDDLQTESTHVSSSNLLSTERVFGATHFEQLGLSVTTELHQCQPGSSTCGSGGTIEVSLNGQTVCVMSLGILQSASTENSSHYRVDWNPDRQGRYQSEDEKLRLLEQVAAGGLPSSQNSFHRLMRSAYGFDPVVESDDEVRRKLVSTIFRAIVNSHRGLATNSA